MQSHTLEKNYFSFSQHLREKSNVPVEHTSPISSKIVQCKPTLGISIGNRMIGIAIIQNNELLYFKLKDFKGKWSNQKQVLIVQYIQKLCEIHHVERLVCKHSITVRCPESSLIIQLQQLYPSMELLTTIELRQVYRNVSIMINQITSMFPELIMYKQRYHTVSRNSYRKLFEAIAISWKNKM